MFRIKFVIFLLLITSVVTAKVENLASFNTTSMDDHKVRIIDSGFEALKERIEMINRATKTIDVEYLIYNRDQSGRLVTQALLKKAREGVKVRMLFDNLLIVGQIDPFVSKQLNDAGIEIKFYNTASLLELSDVQFKNHRKTLIIDNKEFILGGRNIGDDYFDLSDHFNFLDRDVVVQGPITEKVTDTFNVFWNSKVSELPKKMPAKPPIKIDPTKYSLKKLKSRSTMVYKWYKKVLDARDFLTENDKDKEVLRRLEKFPKEYKTHTVRNITFVSDLPGKKVKSTRIISHYILEQMEALDSGDTMTIDTPYFLVDKDLKVTLKTLLERGTKVEVHTNSLYSTDAIYVNTMFNWTIRKWIKGGLHVYTFNGFKPDFLMTPFESIRKARFGTHAKSVVFNDTESMISTFNFDPHSKYFNAESGLFFHDNPEMAKELRGAIHRKMKYARKLTSSKDVSKHKFDNVSFGKSVLYYLLGPITLLAYPIL